ncbi:aspartyl-tRNA(Asn)/glutamyl-tRNA(Gln) amidotransferase subunit A [Rhizobium subbaraonis]|uniref:Indoleacetamide hydrolase n=2 Tax=Rhizobium subbaraonis TaxID=908946 RepID=A0A285UTQ6_9HYPH|nr:aspartyl-tRNA(Asn)/glutamyl-tRNA(Gln) amidotransferase subunit A [Rhizobium subbaraonis]
MKSIAQLSSLIQSGQLDPLALAEETIAGIEAYSDKAVFTTLTRDRALAEARAASARIRNGRSLGALDGIPIAWKDLFAMEGLPTTAGSKVLANDPPAAADAAVVALLKAAGMVSVGRVNMSEFAFSGLGINPHYGTPANPISTDGHRLPGGSSSGSGVAVAAGLVPVSIGTDTGGSVRIPAAFNGIVGYKATRGRYSMQGVYPLSKSLDSLGPLCRTVKDAVLIDAAMRGATTPTLAARSVRDLALLIPETVMFDGAEPEVVAGFEAALERLQAAGAKIRRSPVPVFGEIFELMARHGALVTAEAYALHQTRLAGAEADGMDPRVVARARLGANISMPDYIATLDARERLIARMADILRPGELIASPTLPHVAPKVAPLIADDDAFFAMNGKTLRNTLIGNFLDWCGVSLPCGHGAHGMPVGFLLSGPANADELLLGHALAAEEIVRG